MELFNLATRLEQVFPSAWSIQSSSKWTPENPALGQCGVTALVVNDMLGGDILKTESLGGTHFYNRIFGKRYDFTECQFAEPIPYQDVVSNREEAFLDTNEDQYNFLKTRVNHLLGLSLTDL